MKKIEFLDDPTLWKLERQFEAPKNLIESLVLRGVRAELAERRALKDAGYQGRAEVVAVDDRGRLIDPPDSDEDIDWLSEGDRAAMNRAAMEAAAKIEKALPKVA